MKKKIEFDSGKKVFPIIVSVIGTALMLAMWITRLNMTAVICVGFCCIVSALIVIGMFFKRRLYLGFLIGYCAALFGVITYYIIFGADAGFIIIESSGKISPPDIPTAERTVHPFGGVSISCFL